MEAVLLKRDIPYLTDMGKSSKLYENDRNSCFGKNIKGEFGENPKQI